MNSRRVHRVAGFRRSVPAQLILAAMLAILPSCRSSSRAITGSNQEYASPSQTVRYRAVAIQGIACLYDQKPWLNLDGAGDRDPEGIWFRAFLDPGTGRGVLADGTFHVEMYLVDRAPGSPMTRTLVSDWHYPSSTPATIKRPGMLGEGYVLQLRWADKSLVGKEVEFITRFEDAFGNVVRSGTKRLRVPKYES